ncbi:DUF262 domain-containing protein [Filomicrobium sp.]|uniref:DUF262 domain-containing protein n=1 Tax=Filomicrobium sp. TaxID=2024831 RepID=UPI002586E7FD|nr:DUF262 domain-containing protein [Filomicrobium sp.]MCV0370500.1 DUF262 domain-containing protein [Filomicrobium sp.]
MEARSKTIEAWFSMIEQGQINLPRFQRHEAWRPAQIAGLFENIMRTPPLPVGVLLILEVGDKELFRSRPIVGAPASNVRPSMHLLDGQQRMTALWRSLTDNYDDIRVFVRLLKERDGAEDDDATESEEVERPLVEIVKRWDRKGVMQPVWADDDVACIKRGLAPLAILRPGGAGETAFKAWRDRLREAKAYTDDIGDLASELRKRVQGYVLPFLSLPVATSRETALEVFINMNTSASPLKDFDIVVAQVEEAAGESLHDKIAELLRSIPAAKDYGRIEGILLSVAALLLDKPPLKKTYLGEEFGTDLMRIWPQVAVGLERGLQFLSDEALFDEKSLPSEVAVYLTCALWAAAASLRLDQEGNARSLIRKVLWRACFTNRYGKTSATRAYSDFRTLHGLIKGDDSPACELFNETVFRLPDIEEIKAAGWPGRKDRLPRAILATSLRRKALDFADGAPINKSNIAARELDHLYACGFLKVGRDDPLVNRALNCALITSATNRNKSGSAPSIYIAKRAQAANLGADVVRWRLATHLIPYEEVIADDYEAFLNARAALVEADMRALCNGMEPTA